MPRPENLQPVIKACPICPRKDRNWIETLMAAGAYYDDLRVEFGLTVPELKLHEAMHCTMQPSVDPLTLLREMRWLNEMSQKMVRREFYNRQKDKPDNGRLDRRIKTINAATRVLREYSQLTNAAKRLDQHIVLPRWHQVISKLSEKLKDIPGAMEALQEWAKEEGPANTGVMVKTREIEKAIELERNLPSVIRPDHTQHRCPRCHRHIKCFNPLCKNREETCRACVLDLKKEEELAKVGGEQLEEGAG